MSQFTQMINLIHIPGTEFVFSKEKKLGEGYGGEIYEGFSISNSQAIAVKILNNNPGVENQITCSQIKQIARKNFSSYQNAELKPNRLIEIIDIIQLDKTYIIMQLCKCNLKQYLLCKGKLKEFEALKIIKNIVQALIKIEKTGYHFCDLKPQNILITKQNEAKLGDLDSLIILKNSAQKNQQRYRHEIFGTLHYMPPELIEFGEYGTENYIWTLGVILHQIIYQRPPFNMIITSQKPSFEDKKILPAEFYKNLFKLQICTYESNNYPKIHFLLKNMLRVNQRKRISLQNLFEHLQQDQNTKEVNQFINYQQPFGKISQATQDNSVKEDIIQFGISNISKQIYQATIKSTLETDQNQKQSLSRIFISEPLRTSKNQNQQKWEQKKQNQVTEIHFLDETFLLINQIHNPLVLVKKLEELKKSLQNILCYQNGQNKRYQKVQQQKKMQNILKSIKQSKAFSHLEKTVKYSTCENDKRLNSKELILWDHFNCLFNQYSFGFNQTYH